MMWEYSILDSPTQNNNFGCQNHQNHLGKMRRGQMRKHAYWKSAFHSILHLGEHNIWRLHVLCNVYEGT